MQPTKLFEVLLILNKRQINDLEKFIEVSGNDLGEKKAVFLQLLAECKKRKVLKEEKFKETYAKDWNQKQWNRAKTSYHNVLERYLGTILIEEDQFWRDYLMLKSYFANNLNKNFEALWKKMNKNLKESPKPIIDKRLKAFFLYRFKAHEKKSSRKESNFLNDSEKALDEYYVLQKIRLACAKMNQAKITKIPYSPSKIDEIIFREDILKDFDNVEIKLYAQLYLLLCAEGNEKEQYFEKIASLFEEVKEQVSTGVQKEILEHLMNYCASKMNQGEYVYIQIYQEYLFYLDESDLLTDHDKLNIHHFGNYVTISLLARKYKWLEGFIERCESKLVKEKETENVIKLSKGRLFLFRNEEKEDIDRSHNEIANFSSQDKNYNIIYEKLLLKIFYEKKEEEAMDNRMKKFQSYLKNLQKKEKIDITSSLKFMEYLKQLSKNGTINLNAIKGEISLLDYEWFAKKIETKRERK